MEETYGQNNCIMNLVYEDIHVFCMLFSSRGYEDPITYEQPTYDAYPYGHGPTTHTHTGHVPSNAGIGTANMAPRGPYDVSDYDTDYNRRDYYPNSSNFGGALRANNGYLYIQMK